MTKGKVLISAKAHPILTEKLTGAGFECIEGVTADKFPLEEILKEVKGIVTSNAFAITKEVIDKASSLQWIGRLGSGMEIIDVAYANKKGIRCFSSPEGNANAVAEHALGMLLALTHKIIPAYCEMKNGEWHRESNRGMELAGKTAAIIGYGNNGAAFAQKLTAMDVQVMVYDKYKSGFDSAGIIECRKIEDVFSQADIISFHVPLNEETYHYFNAGLLNKIHKNIILLNLSRGGIVDTRTVLHGMISGKIIGAAMDVWEYEPLTKAPKEYCDITQALLKMPNFIGTPHIAGYTTDALYKMSDVLADKLLHAFG